MPVLLFFGRSIHQRVQGVERCRTKIADFKFIQTDVKGKIPDFHPFDRDRDELRNLAPLPKHSDILESHHARTETHYSPVYGYAFGDAWGTGYVN